MFKLASLVAVTAAATAAATAKQDAAKAKAYIKKEDKSLKGLIISGSTKVGAHFTVPKTATKDSTWTDTETDCWTCAFTEGVWTKPKAGASSCVYDKAELANLAKGVTVADKKTDPEGLSLHAKVAADLTYKDLFASVEGCAAYTNTIKETQALNAVSWALTTTKSS